MFPRFRGLHILTRHEDGLERCVGCELCAVACPADAIFVEAAENDPAKPASHGERYAQPVRDQHAALHLLRHVRGGVSRGRDLPREEVRARPTTTRDAFIYTKDELLVGPEKNPATSRSADSGRRGSRLAEEARPVHP